MDLATHANTQRLRALRLAKEAQEAEQRAREAALMGGSAQDFWDNVNTSAGTGECHPWTGYLNDTWTTYQVGEFELEGCNTTLVHRIVCFLTFGKEPTADIDIVPLCDNHICCNVKHLAVKPHNSAGLKHAVPAEEFFAHCDAWPGCAGVCASACPLRKAAA